MKGYEVEMLNKIDSKAELTERELQSLVYEFDEIEREEGDDRRWSRSITSIIKIGERYFALDWDKGLTECQENSFYEQPYEVEPHTYEKTITINEWRKK